MPPQHNLKLPITQNSESFLLISHPEEFKAVRAAYDAIRKGATGTHDDDFLKVRPIEATIAPELVQTLKSNAIAQLDFTIEDLIRETF